MHMRYRVVKRPVGSGGFEADTEAGRIGTGDRINLKGVRRDMHLPIRMFTIYLSVAIALIVVAPPSIAARDIIAREATVQGGAVPGSDENRSLALVRSDSGEAPSRGLPHSESLPQNINFEGSEMVAPGSGRRVEDRIAVIERAIGDLQTDLQLSQALGQPQRLFGGESRGLGSPHREVLLTEASSGENLSLRLDGIERGLQVLTGRLEQMLWRQNQNSQKIETLIEALEAIQKSRAAGTVSQTLSSEGQEGFQPAGEVDPGEAAGPSSVAAQGDGSASSQSQPSGEVSPEEAYEAAYSAFTNGNYPRAESLFRSFLILNKDDPLAPDAQYNLGEVLLAIGDNAAAADAFLTHVKNWPEDRRHVNAYIRLGISFFRAGNKEQACGLLNSITERFPQISVQQSERLNVAKQEAGC